jgi:putative ABC transport system permease protein
MRWWQLKKRDRDLERELQSDVERGCAGIVVALILVRFMRSMLFQISAYDPKNFLAVMAVLSAVVLVACLIPALRATRVDPMVALRSE